VGFAQVKPALEKLKFSPGFQDAYAQAKAYSALADKNHQDYFRMAEEKFRKLIKESPEKPKNYISYGRMLAKEGRNKEALAVYDKALRLLPPLNDPRLNKKHAQAIKKEKYFIHKGRAEAYYSQEKFSQAEDCYRRALVSRPSDVFLYKKIANTYYEREDLEKAIEYNKKGYLLNEENPVWPFSIALIYKESGNKKRALIYAEKALELSPDNKQFKKFVNELK
jgi:tetratricopeptide (TPR) repeat protein